MWTCKHCNQQFNFTLTPEKANHSRWCDKNPKIESYRCNQNIAASIRQVHDSKLGAMKTFKVVCHKCQVDFEVKERESKFPSKSVYYCSRSCANSHIVSDDHRKKTSASLSGKPYQDPIEISIQCEECLKPFTYIKKYNDKRNRRFCTPNCSTTYDRRYRDWEIRKTRPAFLQYKLDCAFRFKVTDYPDEFDLTLVEQHGWYSPTNSRNSNIKGVSRDHMVSIRFGFDNNLPSEHLRHPANCELMQHTQNVSKGPEASITYDQLLERIKSWDGKYQSRS